MKLQDHHVKAKIYRDHDAEVESDRKACQQGFQITAQSETTGEYTIEKPGIESGWIHFETTEESGIGAWSQCVPAIDEEGTIYPISQSFGKDTTYSGKSSIPNAADSENAESLGLVLQTLENGAEKLVFFPLATGKKIVYAKILWNIQDDGEDLSECWLMEKTEGTWSKIEGGNCWIDYFGSTMDFDTAGDDTIFIVEEIGTETRTISEVPIEKPLYVAKKCIEDSGTRIFYYAIEDKENMVFSLIGNDLLGSITGETRIQTESTNNQIIVYVDEMEWDTTNASANFAYLDRAGKNTSSHVGSPIRPVFSEGIIWESAILHNETSIATYSVLGDGE